MLEWASMLHLSMGNVGTEKAQNSNFLILFPPLRLLSALCGFPSGDARGKANPKSEELRK